MELRNLYSNRIERFHPDTALVAGKPDVQQGRDGRSWTYLWADAEGVGAQLVVSWDKGAKRYRSTVQGVTVRYERGMRMVTIENLVMNPRSSAMSDMFGRFSESKLSVFALEALRWVREGCTDDHPVYA